ncbi:SOS response-associated peptidase [Subtercola vilae]|uniref:Abasic site processing protein n=1 Tax=Subtercola vilae TaxID=2056433 RepID=A0A4T2C026_9MICO|nr:SOS response-associated peptidase [Subtercola vilae]TIH36321.1 SOS response-associated peptidase [Subtercola vilae]
MCGRFAMNKETDDLILEFVARGGDPQQWRPSYSVAPTDSAPIIRERMHTSEGETDSGADEGADAAQGSGAEAIRELELAAWGLKPAWAKPGGPAPINARLESVATNGMFRSAFASHRCIVPMTGYYEWQQQADGKQPYFIHADTDLLAAAGLYSARRVNDEWKVTFTIITREARDASGDVHERMPVFLTPDLWDRWLDPTPIAAKDAALAALDRSSLAVARSITTYPVARAVNNSRTLDPADPTLIAPVSLPL